MIRILAASSLTPGAQRRPRPRIGTALVGRSMPDERWIHGMNGWRVKMYNTKTFGRLTDNPVTIEAGREGEVTGYQHSGCFIWVVFDDEVEPRQMRWTE